MIIHFQGSFSDRYAGLADQMFRQRAEVFGRIKGWDVVVRDGRERDALDDLDPLYVISTTPDGEIVRGSLRLLPTTGPTLLKLALRDLFDEPIEVESPTIWECTRLALNPDYPHEMDRGCVAAATREMMMATCQLALESGVAQIMGVYERPLQRLYARVGWAPKMIAESRGIAVGLWDVSEAALDRMERRGVEGLGYAHAA